MDVEGGCCTFGKAPVVVIGDVLLLSACDGVMVLQQGHCKLKGPCAQLPVACARVLCARACVDVNKDVSVKSMFADQAVHPGLHQVKLQVSKAKLLAASINLQCSVQHTPRCGLESEEQPVPDSESSADHGPPTMRT